MPPRPHRPRSFRRARGSGSGAIALAVLLGLAVGLALVAASLKLRAAHAHHADAIALATPLVAALAAAALSALSLHTAKVWDRDAAIAVAIAVAAPAFAAGQLARIFDPAAGGDAAFGSLTYWSRGGEWMAQIGVVDLATTAPGLRAVGLALGREATWILLACELLLVAALVLAAVDAALSAPLCVACRRWCRRERAVAQLAGELAPERAAERAQARDWRFFRQLGPRRGRAALRFDVARCPACDRSNALTVWHTRPLRRARALVADLRLGPDDMRTVLELRR